MLETGKAVWGNDPEIARALDEQANRLRDPSIDPATRAGMTDSVAKTLDMLATKGSDTTKREGAQAKAHSFRQQVIAFQRQAAQIGVNTWWLNDIEKGAPDIMENPTGAATFWEGIANSIANNTQVLERLKIAQSEKGGFPSLGEAFRTGIDAGASGMSVSQTASGQWLLQAQFPDSGKEPDTGEPITVRVGDRSVKMVWDPLSKKYLDPNTSLSREDLFRFNPVIGETVFNEQLFDAIYQQQGGKTSQERKDGGMLNDQGLELQPNTNEPRVTTNEDLASVPANGFFWMKDKNGEWVRKQKTAARR
jgi:hypothetical protein